MCIAPGPGKDMIDSTRIIGEKQYNAGKVNSTDWSFWSTCSDPYTNKSDPYTNYCVHMLFASVTI